MEKRNDTHVQMLLPEIEAMIAVGKSQREVAEQFGFKDNYVSQKTTEATAREASQAGSKYINPKTC
ncbi:hypothetical protein [Anaeromassilibacillus senegalensis]|uniref:hypothetical protein n=1 Tax=Anaeromassilibacillus senegalensis TaxID=1673717 RepID=UPI0006811CCD|nr:hypothetical protein [Anaeromassilibacillus senegalensis]